MQYSLTLRRYPYTFDQWANVPVLAVFLRQPLRPPQYLVSGLFQSEEVIVPIDLALPDQLRTSRQRH